MKCKHCGHTITMAGGMSFHTEDGFSHTCKVCGCHFPEEEEHSVDNK